jgi:hypothetical protein
VAEDLANAQGIGKEVSVKDGDGKELDPNVFGVVEAVAEGSDCIIVAHALPTGETYENVFTINDL